MYVLTNTTIKFNTVLILLIFPVDTKGNEKFQYPFFLSKCKTKDKCQFNDTTTVGFL